MSARVYLSWLITFSNNFPLQPLGCFPAIIGRHFSQIEVSLHMQSNWLAIIINLHFKRVSILAKCHLADTPHPPGQLSPP